MNIVKIVNIALVIIAILLFVNLVQPIGSLVGNAIYSADASEPECYFSNGGELNVIPIDRCCYEVQNQITCTPSGEGPGLKCYISDTSTRYYLINMKTFQYCEKEGYDVKIQ